jgi:uncharacterized protein YjbJ (UPF0337 family)
MKFPVDAELKWWPSVNDVTSFTKEKVMDWNRVEGNWKQMKGKIKEQWGKLTDDDLDVINGKRDQLEGRIQERYGYAKDQSRKEIDDWYNFTKMVKSGWLGPASAGLFWEMGMRKVAVQFGGGHRDGFQRIARSSAAQA